jgi:hypothetical protein
MKPRKHFFRIFSKNYPEKEPTDFFQKIKNKALIEVSDNQKKFNFYIIKLMYVITRMCFSLEVVIYSQIWLIHPCMITTPAIPQN